MVNIKISFSKLSYGSPIDKTNILIEVSHNKITEKIVYSQSASLIMKLNPKLEKEIFHINIKSIMAHGQLIIYQNFLSEKPKEKLIQLYKNRNNDNIRYNHDIIGKIFAQIKLDESPKSKSSFKEKSNKKENIQAESPKKNDDIIKSDKIISNEVGKNYINFDENNINMNNLYKFLNYEDLNKLKELIDNKHDSLPKDINLLRSFNQNIFNQYKLLDEHFSKILSSILEENQNLKEKITQTTDKNKEIEEDINNLKLECNKKEENLKQNFNELKEKNEKFLKSIDSIKIQKNNVSQETDFNQKKVSGDNNDIKDICNLIKNLDSLGYKLNEGDITDSERQNLNDLLKKIDTDKISNYNEDVVDENELNDLKEDLELSDMIISLIERDVNDLFSRKLIEMVTIDQIDSISYTFSTEKKKKQISFKIENNNLICSTGETFTVWLIKNFSL